MKITKRSKEISRTINLGNFNSIRIDNAAEAIVEDGDTLEAVDTALYTEIRRAVLSDLRNIKAERKAAKSDSTQETA